MVDIPKLAMIVARSRNNVIGIDGDLPWKISTDLKFFKKATLGKPVLMGRVTWDSLPFPLPGRPNLVLTRNVDFNPAEAEVFYDIRKMVGRGFELAGALNVDEVMVIGGARLYAQLLPFCHRLYITDVQTDIEGDAFFPNFDKSQWVETQTIRPDKGDRDDFPIIIRIYDRK